MFSILMTSLPDKTLILIAMRSLTQIAVRPQRVNRQTPNKLKRVYRASTRVVFPIGVVRGNFDPLQLPFATMNSRC